MTTKEKHRPNLVLLLLVSITANLSLVSCQFSFRFDSSNGPSNTAEADTTADLTRLSATSANISSSTSGAGLIWPPPLRATFRPLNRQTPPTPPTPPTQPPTPTPPLPPPEPLVLTAESDSFSSPTSNSFENTRLASSPPLESRTTTVAPITSTANPLDDEDLPTRVPLNRFRPTRPPSVDPPSPALSSLFSSASTNSASTANNQQSPRPNGVNNTYRITNECFECICEASTSCNANSRCQTSDVRHTRCGMFLISYDQWVDTELSKELVTQEALARDAAADERAFYECVTTRDCAERLMSIYLQKNGKDCDKDGRIDCYDLAAIHQGGVEGCSSESLLESQYWSDFNACFGFGR